MCKSKSNGVDPQDLIEKYGADTARLYTMFTAPPEATLEWNDAARRRHATASCAASGTSARSSAATECSGRGDRDRRGRPRSAFGKEAKALRREVHTVLQPGRLRLPAHAIQHRGVGRDEAAQRAGGLQGADGSTGDRRRGARRLRHPAARAVPGHAAHRARAVAASWATTSCTATLLDAPWPAVDVAALVQDEIELMLQVNGKLRGSLRVPAGARKAGDREDRAGQRSASPSMPRAPCPRSVIVVPGRLVNVVV